MFGEALLGRPSLPIVLARRAGMLAVVALLLSLVVTATAAAQGAALQLSPAVASPGQLVTVTGSGFSAAAGVGPVSIRLSNRTGTVLNSTLADSSGRISVSVQVPSSLSPGLYLVLATQTSANGTARNNTPGRAKLRVSGPAGPDPSHRGERGADALPTAPGPVAVSQEDVRVDPNYRLDADPAPFRGRDQVGLAVNPRNPQHVVQISANYLDLRCESSVSFDGGSTWSAALALSPPAPTAIESPFAPSCSTYQSVEFGSGQNVYTTATAQRTMPAFPDASALVFKSTDGGVTWQPGVVAMRAGAGTNDTFLSPSTGPRFSRPNLSVDPGEGTGGTDRVYVVALDTTGPMPATPTPPCAPTIPPTRCFPVKAAVSDDGAESFSAPVDVSPLGISTTEAPSKPVVNPDHSVTVAWRTYGPSALLQAARSTDGGKTWSEPVAIAAVTNTGTSPATHVPPATPGVGASSTATYPRMVGDPRTGDLYLVYSQGSTGPTAPPGGFQGSDHFISPDAAVWFQRSKDYGDTWSTPERISNGTKHPGSELVQTRHPSVSVSPNGRVNVVWHDRRHWYQGPGERTCTHSHIFCEDIRLSDTYYSYSTDRGATFSPNIRITDHSFNSDVGYDTRPSGYWNFGPQSVTVAGDRVLVGWMDSREGNWDTDNEDVYLARVDFDSSGAAPQTTIDEPDAVSRSVALSKLGYEGGSEGAMIGGARDPAGPGGVGPATRNASRIVIVNENDIAGALAGQVLARANPAPVLLSAASGLPAAVKDEVAAIRPAGAYVVGDQSQLSEQVISDLSAAGVPGGQITRLSGGSDAATAALIAAQFDRRLPAEKTAGAPAFDAAVIANPADPDAAAAAGLAAARRLPILYVNADSVPPETQAALSSLKIDRTLVIGGPQSVGAAVHGQLPSAERLGGADQYETSKMVVAESRARGLPSNVVYVADGSKPMDAALLGGVAARTTGILMLAPDPAHSTAAVQAASFGLRGVDRFFVVGPLAALGSGGPAAGPPAAADPPVGGGVAPGPRDTTRPSLRGVSVRPSVFRVRPSRRGSRLGTTIRFTVSEAAKVAIVVGRRATGRRLGGRCVGSTRALRPRPSCIRILPRGSLTRNARKGASVLRFNGRVRGRLLATGRYQFVLRATDAAGNRSARVLRLARVVR